MIVTFNYTAWAAMFPQFATTVPNSGAAQLWFNMATLYVSNGDCAIIPYDTTLTPPITLRGDILNLVTAHVAQLMAGSSLSGNAPSPLVGRVSDATQGSVSVSAELDGVPGSAAWFTQTPWGFAAWAAMAPFRTAQYRPSPGRFAQIPGNMPWISGFPGNGGWAGPWG